MNAPVRRDCRISVDLEGTSSVFDRKCRDSNTTVVTLPPADTKRIDRRGRGTMRTSLGLDQHEGQIGDDLHRPKWPPLRVSVLLWSHALLSKASIGSILSQMVNPEDERSTCLETYFDSATTCGVRTGDTSEYETRMYRMSTIPGPSPSHLAHFACRIWHGRHLICQLVLAHESWDVSYLYWLH